MTSSSTHPHGIKVMLEDGRVGRVKGSWLPITEIAKDFLKRSDSEREEVSLLPGDSNLRHSCDITDLRHLCDTVCDKRHTEARVTTDTTND